MNNRKSDFSIDTLLTELQVILLEMISISLIDNDQQLLLDFHIDDILAKKLCNDLLSLSSDHQTLLLEKVPVIIDFKIKEGTIFSSSPRTISDRRESHRSTVDIYSNRVNFLLLRLVTMATRLYDDILLDNFGVQFKNAVNMLKMEFSDQHQLVRNCSASKGLAIDVKFNSKSFYLALNQVHNQCIENSFIDKLLKKDISRETIKEFFGIAYNEFTLRKKILDIDSKRGPKHQLTNQEALLIDADWVKDISYFKNLYDDLDDEWRVIDNTLMKYYILNRKYDIPIGSIVSHNNILNNNKIL